ncbi:carotenoid biosynthesis protein [Streptomyces chitinivorans]|uniref:Carotenoid biosynthesis protein n=1 Tax=Streptomyces chitinivorans TaxID=1257027 RepID=A0ABW7HML7_9ACTN|nr:carotenoid biosynthesis protein [Streptomyces chitinivorans]MDH2410473.1 carotenoid biosynthesis protein [Streptomyces chitinivorans]
MVQVQERPALRRGHGAGRRTAWALAAAAVLCQIPYPLVSGPWREALTVAGVAVFCLASLAAAALRHGARGPLALFTVAGLGGLAVEAVGVRTGFPFGSYHYTGSLGPSLAGVPVVVPLAWMMMAWPALEAGRVLAGDRGRAGAPASRVRTAVAGGWALASWDVFLDPQMVDAGHWVWSHPRPGLPGVEGVPLTNFAGWVAVSVVMVAAVDAVSRRPVRRPAGNGAPGGPAVVLYLWTYASSVTACLVFFGRPQVALVGGVLMGLVAVPLAARAAGAAGRRG